MSKDKSTWEKIQWFLSLGPKAIGAVYDLVKLIWKLKMADKKKTTNYAAVAAIILALLWTVLSFFGIDVPVELQDKVLDAIKIIELLILAIIGWWVGR